MLARPFRALGLVLLRLAAPIFGSPAVTLTGRVKADRVVFRHYV